MKNFANYICVLGILILSACKKYQPPVVEKCTILSESIICTDPRIEDLPDTCWEVEGAEDTYECPIEKARGYQCTSIEGYQQLEEWSDKIMETLKECERNKMLEGTFENIRTNTGLPYPLGGQEILPDNPRYYEGSGKGSRYFRNQYLRGLC